MGGKGNVFWILMGRPEGKIPLGRPRHRWEYNKTVNSGENNRILFFDMTRTA
jgi:hypothetical protein